MGAASWSMKSWRWFLNWARPPPVPPRRTWRTLMASFSARVRSSWNVSSAGTGHLRVTFEERESPGFSQTGRFFEHDGPAETDDPQRQHGGAEDVVIDVAGHVSQGLVCGARLGFADARDENRNSGEAQKPAEDEQDV